jgi:hypothetical protein
MKFRIKPADTFIWNLTEFVEFLIAHQGQEILIETGTEGCCATAIGLYSWLDKFNFKKVVIKTGNPLEQHSNYKIRYVLPWKFLKTENAIDDKYHQWNKKYVFGTLYGRPLWHRIAIAAHLLTFHKQISKVGFIADPTNVDNRKLFELSELWQHDPASLANFCKIQDQLPLAHADIEKYTPGVTLTDGFTSQSKQVYVDFLIDIVAETFTSGNCFFVTEKTVRPMLLKKPFIIFGSKDFLAYLRQLGFRTFSDFWDEDYDGYSGQDRYLKILKLIDEIAIKSYSELESMYWDMQYTLDYNYNLLVNKSYKNKITQI